MPSTLGALLALSLTTNEAQAAAPAAYVACATCHGETGKGDGPAAAGLATQPADFGTVAPRPDEELKKIIKEGGASVGLSPLMLGFPQLSDAELSSLVDYIKSLRQ